MRKNFARLLTFCQIIGEFSYGKLLNVDEKRALLATINSCKHFSDTYKFISDLLY